VGFVIKDDFRGSFKEDRKSNEAPKKCRKQGEPAHGRALGSTAVLPGAWPCATSPCFRHFFGASFDFLSSLKLLLKSSFLSKPTSFSWK